MILVRLISGKVNACPLMCAVTLIFYRAKVKNMFHVAELVNSTVLKCCSLGLANKFTDTPINSRE